ncbi:MAG: PAS domain S-box protein [Bacteroidales bacterium]|nr:PAS domain S-box protein [Bacteroidales bacterium]
MNNKISKQLVSQFITASIIISIVFYIVLPIVISKLQEIPLSFTEIINIHKSFQILWILDAIPILLILYIILLTRGFKKKIFILEDNIVQENIKADKILHFVEKLKDGQTDAEYKTYGEKDYIGKSMVSLRDNLKKNKEEELARKKEDDQRNWIAEGLAKFGEILRNNNDDIEKLSYEIISNLGLYIDAIQGNFFILNDNDEKDKHFELTASFAYDRKKFADKRIEWGEGLIGRAAYEQTTLYLDEVNDNYVEITSGLGKSNPRYILITPLKINEEVHGVIELALFKELEKYEIDFVEKVAESIASTISSVKISLRTTKLLEDSQEQAERLAQQEEEMRQNMEELQATQEEAAKQSENFISFTNSVNDTLIRAEYDTNGILTYSNAKFFDLLGYDGNTEVEGMHVTEFICDEDKDWFNKIWNELSIGGKHYEGFMIHKTKSGKDLWTISTYSCVKDNMGGVEKILFLGINGTSIKNQNIDLESNVKAINNTCIKVEYSIKGKIITCNDKFLLTFGYSEEEIKDKSIFNLMKEEEIAAFEEIWNNVVNGKFFKGNVKLYTKEGIEKWFQLTYSPMKNIAGEIEKIISISWEITEDRENKNKLREQTNKVTELEEKLKTVEKELSKKGKKSYEK